MTMSIGVTIPLLRCLRMLIQLTQLLSIPCTSCSSNFTRSAIPLPDGARPQYMQVDYLECVPGQGRQLRDLLEKEVLPAYKKAGITGAWVSRRALGTNGREILLGRAFDKWAELEHWLAVGASHQGPRTRKGR